MLLNKASFPCLGFIFCEIACHFSSKGRLEQELKIFPKYRKFWNLMKKKESQMDEAALKRYDLNALPHVFFFRHDQFGFRWLITDQ